MTFFHGIHVIEVNDIAGSASSSSISFDFTPPVITSPLAASTPENAAWSMLLTTDEAATFSRISGADSASFTLDGAMLSLPAQNYEGGHTAFVCNLAAMDAAGNVTPFSVTVTIGDVDEAVPVTGGQLDFTNPDNSGLV